MSQQALTVMQVEGVTVVTFGTRTVLDIAVSEELARELLELTKGPPQPRILIDLSAVRFLASRMLGVLVELSRKAARAGGRVVLCGIQGGLRDVFELTKLNRLLNVRDTRQEGMAALGAAPKVRLPGSPAQPQGGLEPTANG